MQEPISSILTDFGAFGLALLVVGLVGWAIWKKVIEPQQKEARADRAQHVETLNALIERHTVLYEQQISSEKEHIKALQELNGRIELHNQKMKDDHVRVLDELRKK